MDFNAEHGAKRMISIRRSTEYGTKKQEDPKVDEEDEEIRRAMEAQASRSVVMTSLGRNETIGNDVSNSGALNKENFMGLSMEEYQKLRLFNPEDIARHDKADDCWVIIGYIVYDLSTFIYQHPGGPNILLAEAGKDVTQLFRTSHTSIEKAFAMLRNNTTIQIMGRIKKVNDAEGTETSAKDMVGTQTNLSGKEIVTSFHQQQRSLEKQHRNSSDSDGDYSHSELSQNRANNESHPDDQKRSSRSRSKVNVKSKSRSKGSSRSETKSRTQSKTREHKEKKSRRDKRDKKSNPRNYDEE